MAFTPVALTNGSKTVTARTPSELVQYQHDGWVAVGTLPAPSPPTSGGSQGSVQSLLEALQTYFVSRTNLIIQPTTPDASGLKPGTVWINNSF